MEMCTNHKLVTVLLASLVSITTAFSVERASFESITAKPSNFGGKRVTLVGIAHIYGDRFFLYPSVITAKKSDIGKSVFVVTKPNATKYEHLDNHWLSVTGLIDVNEHGPLGGAPCGIILQDLQVIARPALKDSNIYGVLRNETGFTVEVKLSVKNGYSKFAIEPGGIHKQTIDKTSVVEVSSSDGKLIAKRTLLPTNISKTYFDSNSRSYYYRITEEKIEQASPSQAKEWKPIR